MSDERLGSVVGGKYRLLRRLGEGGMGEVYEAQHTVVGRRFAVKFLHQHLAHHGDALLRFRREAQAAGALENDHIASVLDFDAAPDGAPFLVMEYLDGESVGQLLQREGPLPVTRAVGIVTQACRGLEAAHTAGIVHRDLKPDNLFSLRRSDGSEAIKILDFGIAKLLHEEGAPGLTHSGAVVGTPFYMAPEQARGEKAFDERVDIYALGVILYELLSGKKPHPGDSHNAILAHILTEPVVPLATLRASLPQGLAELVARTLSTSRDARPRSAAAFARELAPFAGRDLAQPQRSHFDMRAADVASAKTLPTPDTHALSMPAVAPAAPAKAATTAATARSGAWLAGALLTGAAATAWFVTRNRPTAEPALGSAAPLTQLATSTQASLSVPIAAPSATAPVAPSAAPAHAPVVTRVEARLGKSAASGTPKPATSREKTDPEAPSQRPSFDQNNPYQ
ncbi:MAG: serine/threonine-protein kinase [Polyangiaceae bacterium]